MFELSFTVIAFVTSLLTAITGVGGGLILIAVLPGFVPAATLIPIHAIVQLASNASRAAFAWQHIRWEYIGAFLIGSIIGATIAAQFIRWINLDYILLIISAFILVSVWAPSLLRRLSSAGSEMLMIGLVQTGLGTVGGATGPLANASLLRHRLNKNAIVTTTAIQMAITHISKLIVFMLLGVSISAWWKLILGMSFGVILGSWVGTHFRAQLDDQLYSKIVKALLTVLALRMIYISFA